MSKSRFLANVVKQSKKPAPTMPFSRKVKIAQTIKRAA